MFNVDDVCLLIFLFYVITLPSENKMWNNRSIIWVECDTTENRGNDSGTDHGNFKAILNAWSQLKTAKHWNHKSAKTVVWESSFYWVVRF